MQELIGLLIFICGFVIGWNCLRIWVSYRVKKILLYSANRAQNEKVIVDIQYKDGQYYVYDAETEEFLAQGRKKKDIIDILTKKYPSKSFNAYADNLKDVGL